MNKPVHVMVDLETLSTASNAYILSIGAVIFNGDGIQARFYQAIRTPDLDQLKNMTSNFHISSDTLNWWSQQPDEAREVFTDPRAVHLEEALQSFTDFCRQHSEKDDLRVWGNGAAFDNVILANAYEVTSMERPWQFWNDRCYRTVKNMYPSIPVARTGIHHNAVDDAATQADHLVRIGCFIS